MSEDKALPSLARVHGLMFIASSIVATSFTVGAAITHGLDPAVLTFVRFVIAAACFAPYILLKFGFFFPPARTIAKYSLISGCIVGFFWCMFESLRYTSALNTSALFTLVPGISGIYGAVLLRERLGIHRLIALFCGMIGALWIIFRGDIDRFLALEMNKGDLIFLAGCFLMAFYTPLVKKIHQNEPMAIMTFWILLTGAGWLLLLSIGKLPAVHWQEIDFKVWAGIVYLAIFSSIVTFFLSQYSTLYLGPTRVMAYSYLYPGMVLVIDWLFGHGLPSVRTLPGIVIVLVATVVLQQGGELATQRNNIKVPPKII